jgi:hypothetical protein
MRAVNLIPSEQRSGAAVGAGRSGGGAYAVLGLLVGVALLALLYGLAHHQISSRRSQAATVTAQAQQAEAQATRLAPYTSFIALRESRAQAVATLVNSRFDWAHAFHELGRVLPPEVSISSLDGTIGAAVVAASTTGKGVPESAAGSDTVASATPPGAVPTFTLGGCAVNQPSVALMLERLRLIDGVSEVVLQSSTKGSTAGAGGGASGGCPGGDPAFTVQVNFDALPATSAVSAATKTVASASTPATVAPAAAAGSGTTTTTTSGVTSR